MSFQSIKIYNQLANDDLFRKTINFDLKRIKKVLKKIGNPERKLQNVINIIGSDGKYSLLTSLKHFLEANKKTVSTYTSPSLRNIRERFWMGKRNLSYKEIKKTIKFIQNQKIKLTIFEVLTVIFIIHAAKINRDYNLLEAGALFAKDSTNLFENPLLQAVVNINKQHLNFLKKKTLDEVIHQKVGFLSNNTKIYIGKQNKNVKIKIKKYLKNNKSSKIFSNNWKLIKKNENYLYQEGNFKIKIQNKFIHSKGLLENVAMAIKIAKDLGIKKKIIKKALPEIKFTGRIDYLQKGKLVEKLQKREKLLIDGCHSEVSAKNLANYLRTLNYPIYGILGMSKNKNPNLFIKQFKKIFKKLFVVRITNENSISNQYLYKIAKDNNFKVFKEKNFLKAIKKITSKEKKLICIFGSLYLCGEVLNNN